MASKRQRRDARLAPWPLDDVAAEVCRYISYMEMCCLRRCNRYTCVVVDRVAPRRWKQALARLLVDYGFPLPLPLPPWLAMGGCLVTSAVMNDCRHESCIKYSSLSLYTLEADVERARAWVMEYAPRRLPKSAIEILCAEGGGPGDDLEAHVRLIAHEPCVIIGDRMVGLGPPRGRLSLKTINVRWCHPFDHPRHLWYWKRFFTSHRRSDLVRVSV